MKNKHHNTSRRYHSTGWKQGWQHWNDKTDEKQQWNGGTQFEPTESYSNEQCGKILHFPGGEVISTVIKYKFLVVAITDDK